MFVYTNPLNQVLMELGAIYVTVPELKEHKLQGDISLLDTYLQKMFFTRFNCMTFHLSFNPKKIKIGQVLRMLQENFVLNHNF